MAQSNVRINDAMTKVDRELNKAFNSMADFFPRVIKAESDNEWGVDTGSSRDAIVGFWEGKTLALNSYQKGKRFQNEEWSQRMRAEQPGEAWHIIGWSEAQSSGSKKMWGKGKEKWNSADHYLPSTEQTIVDAGSKTLIIADMVAYADDLDGGNVSNYFARQSISLSGEFFQRVFAAVQGALR